MPTPGQELASLDFESLIGGPLVAVVHAQAQAALATVDFIKQVGFKPPENPNDETLEEQTTGEPAIVTFKYKKTVPKPDGTEEEKTAELTVPFLTMLPIPYLRIEEADLEFLAKIHSMQYRTLATNLKIETISSARTGGLLSLFGSAKFKVTTSYQRQTRAGTKVTRDYSMQVKVKAVQEEMPGGLERLLTILESSIKEKTG